MQMFEVILVASLALAFVIAVLEQMLDIRRFKAVISVLFSAGIVLSMGESGQYALWATLASAFAGPFLSALADRVTSIPLTVTQQIGQRR